jgi:hypothetical protein
MKLIENIKERIAKAVLTEERVGKLLEEIEPYRRWKVYWTQVNKGRDDTDSIRADKVRKSYEAWERDPLAETSIEYRVAYILGKGLGYSCQHEKVREAFDKIWKENNFAIYQFELTRTLGVDGELFLRFPKITLGQIPVIIPIDSTEIKYIARNQDDQRKADYYHRQFIPQTYPSLESNAQILSPSAEIKNENIPADEMIHFKIGALTNMSRGRGKLYRVLEDLDEYKNFTLIRKAVHKALSVFVLVMKITGATQAELDVWQAKLDNYSKYDKSGNVIEAMPSGQPIAINDKMDLQHINPDMKAGSADTDGNRLLLRVCAGTRLPEYMFGSGWNANLASSQSQESPMVKSMEADQEMVRLLFKAIFDKTLQMMIDVGDLDATCPVTETDDQGNEIEVQKIPQELYDLTFPEIAIKDIVPLATALKEVVINKILSRETACTLLGYVWDEEKIKILKEEQEGFKSPQPTTGFPQLTAGLGEEMSRDELNKIMRLKHDCRKELLESFAQYQEDLKNGVPGAKEQFVTRQQEIMQRHLTMGTNEGYAHQIIEVTK